MKKSQERVCGMLLSVQNNNRKGEEHVYLLVYKAIWWQQLLSADNWQSCPLMHENQTLG